MPVRAGPWQQKSREGSKPVRWDAIGDYWTFPTNVANEEVHNRIQNAIGVHDDFLTMVKKRKLRWYDHISRSSGMAKTVLQGTVKGAWSRERQMKRWEDNIKEWTAMGFGDSLRAAEDRKGWKSIVATSSVVPRRPARLRGWDEMSCIPHLSPALPTLRFHLYFCSYGMQSDGRRANHIIVEKSWPNRKDTLILSVKLQPNVIDNSVWSM